MKNNFSQILEQLVRKRNEITQAIAGVVHSAEVLGVTVTPQLRRELGLVDPDGDGVAGFVVELPEGAKPGDSVTIGAPGETGEPGAPDPAPGEISPACDDPPQHEKDPPKSETKPPKDETPRRKRETKTAKPGTVEKAKRGRPRIHKAEPPEAIRFKNVYWHPTARRLCARVMIGGKKHEKYFDDQESAAEWVVEMRGLESIEDLVKE